MPIFEFRCPLGHVTEKLILSRSEADKTEYISCPVGVVKDATVEHATMPCTKKAIKIISAGAFILGGSPGGWEKPSPTAKRVVNPDSISFKGESDYFK